MKAGDLIETHFGRYQALVIDVEKLYPSHPLSPPRNLYVHWTGHPAPFAFGDKKNKISAFSVKVISRG